MDAYAWIIVAPIAYLTAVCITSGVQARRREKARDRHPSSRRLRGSA